MPDAPETAPFLAALARTLAFEGRWSADPADPGGATYCGISRKFWPDWPGWKLVSGTDTPASPELTAAVRAFYLVQFWTPLQASEWGNQALAQDVFDAAVNLGRARAVSILQAALGLPPAAQDGIVGPKTLAAIAAAPSGIVASFGARRALRYAGVVAADPRLAGFLVGWLRRALDRWLP